MILDGDRDRLSEYMRHLADVCGLRDWYFTLSDAEPNDPAHGAECDVVYGQKVATITFRNDWPTWDAERVRSLMVHELIHCHTWSMDQRICDVRDIIGHTTYDVFEKSFREDLERAVDGVARAWAKTLPLPVTAKKRKKVKAA